MIMMQLYGGRLGYRLAVKAENAVRGDAHPRGNNGGER